MFNIIQKQWLVGYSQCTNRLFNQWTITSNLDFNFNSYNLHGVEHTVTARRTYARLLSHWLLDLIRPRAYLNASGSLTTSPKPACPFVCTWSVSSLYFRQRSPTSPPWLTSKASIRLPSMMTGKWTLAGLQAFRHSILKKDVTTPPCALMAQTESTTRMKHYLPQNKYTHSITWGYY